MTVSDVSAESQSYGLPQGAAVRSVTENGPAAEAGLQENDIITAANGETITSSNDLVKLVKASRPQAIRWSSRSTVRVRPRRSP